MLINNFLQLTKICFFKAKPQDVHHSRMTFWAAVLINLAIFTYSMGNVFGYIDGFIIAMVFVGTLTGYVFLILKAFKLKSRFVQTLTALLGSYGLLIVAGFLLSVIIAYLIEVGLAANFLVILSHILMLIIYFWSIAVCAYIFKYALEKGWVIAIINTIAMIVLANLATMIIRQLFLQV